MFKRTSVLMVVLFAVLFAVAACGSPAAPAAPTTAPAGAKPTTAAAAVPKPAPKPGSTPVQHNADFDKDVADTAKAVGFTNYVYEAYTLPGNTKWEDTLAYYDGEMKKAGWSGSGQVMDIDGGKVGAFVNKETKTGLVIFFLASPDGTKPAFDLAIFGQ